MAKPKPKPRATSKRRKKVIVVDPTATRDAELRAMIEERPGDADAILVYADWLEEQGDMQRAKFLRDQEQLRVSNISHPRLLVRGRALHDLGKTLPAEWVAAVTHPKLAGTAWAGHDDDGSLVWRFLANGMVNYTQPSGTFENGRWTQIGVTVAMDTNAHYADYFGVIVGDWIRGNAHNIVEHKWRWKVQRTDDPKTAPVPEDVNRTIHDDHVRRKATPKSKSKKGKKPVRVPVLTLTRKTPLKRKQKIRRSRR